MDGNKKPNIIIIMTDEHDPGVTGCYGNEIITTPNIDALARRGITFDAAYTNSPLCVPARLSFTAGKYISRIHAWNNSSSLSSDFVPSLPRLLNEAGYETILCGKQHYARNRRYGFQKDLLPHHNQNIKKNLISRRAPDDLTPNPRSWINRSAEFHEGDDSKVLNKDREVTRETVTFLKGRTREDPPFFLFVGYLAPHFPLVVPSSLAQKYMGRVPMPDIPGGMLESQPLNYHHLRAGFGVVNPDPEIVRRGRELYYALVEWMDGQVGEVLSALEASAVKDDTIVIFTTDHGENKGDHGLWWKNNLYDHASRVPLIIQFPDGKNSGQRRSKSCSLVDLVQTIVHLAGSSTPDDWDGDSLLPYIEDDEFQWKDLALSEYYGHNIASGMTMVRSGNFKYIYHNKVANREPDRELYDLESDPTEFDNLALDNHYQELVRDLHSMMVEELGEEPDAIESRYLNTPLDVSSRIVLWAVNFYKKLFRKARGAKKKKK